MLNTNFKILDSMKYGKVLTFYNKNESKLENGYIIRGVKKNRLLTGYIDLTGKVIINLEEMAFDEYFMMENGDICLSFRLPSGYDKYYYLKKNKDSYNLVMHTDTKDPLKLTKLRYNDNYLLLSSVKDANFSLYDINYNLIKTSAFSKLQIVSDSNIHKFYFEKKIYGLYKNNKIYATTICGFLDKDCILSSDILDMNSDGTMYDANIYHDTLSSEFNELCTYLAEIYVQKQIEKNEENHHIKEYMFDNPVEIVKKKTIIYDFNSRKKV